MRRQHLLGDSEWEPEEEKEAGKGEGEAAAQRRARDGVEAGKPGFCKQQAPFFDAVCLLGHGRRGDLLRYMGSRSAWKAEQKITSQRLSIWKRGEKISVGYIGLPGNIKSLSFYPVPICLMEFSITVYSWPDIKKDSQTDLEG